MKYLSENYDTLICHSYDYNQERQDNSPAWEVIRSLYEKNYVQCMDTTEKIPKLIHQIWLGGELPHQYKKWADSWLQFNPDWKYRLWTDVDVENGMVPCENRGVFNRIRSVGQKSDYLRYHILNEFGGIYVDTDFECLKSLDPLLYLDFYTGVGFPGEVELYIGLIATIPHHPIMGHIVSSIDPKQGRGWLDIFNSTGSYFFTRKFLEVVKKDTEGVVAFPTDFFYPFPNNFRKTGNPYSYVKPCSFAIHHWEVSWLNKR